MIIRQAIDRDAAAMCAVINPLILAGGSTAITDEFTPDTMRAYVLGEQALSCVVAQIDNAVQGWQVLRVPKPEYNMPPDWAVIATFVSMDAKQGGIGGAMMAETIQRARRVGIKAIDATIKRYNTGGQAFYSKMGFVDYAQNETTVSKKLAL